MKIAAKVSLTAVTTLLGLGLGLAPVWAQETALPSTEKVAAQGAIDSAVPGPSGLTGEDAIADSIKIDVAAHSQPVKKEESFAGTIEEEAEEDVLAPSPEIPDSVKSVVKRLNHATKDVTLEDLNSAREAVIKLDVLIDIEKRLNDLFSLRKEREEQEDSFSAAIPAAALAPPPAGAYAAPAQPAPIMPLPTAEVEVLRIAGASGHYSAMIKDGDGSERTVRTGDSLADGALVQGISRYGVTVKTGGKTRTIQVKDAPTVFSNR